MNTKTTQSWELSQDDIKTAIAEWLEKKFGAGKPITVSINVRTVSTGFGAGEGYDHVAEIVAKREV